MSEAAPQEDWRTRPLESVLNLRDFGGYGCGTGALPRGKLWRSGHMARATDADLDALHALGIAVVVDLRSEPERSEQPSRRHADFAGRVIEADGAQDAPPHEASVASPGAVGPEDVRRHMLAAYRELPWRPGMLDAYARTFEALAEAPGPLLIHCAAGKDRTGVLAALLHHVAGVSDADVMEDYLLTNRVQHPPARRAKFARWMKQTYGSEPSDEAIQVALGVEPVFLEAAWGEMRARHGSVDGYLEQALGVTPDRRRAVEHWLTS